MFIFFTGQDKSGLHLLNSSNCLKLLGETFGGSESESHSHSEDVI